MHRHLLDPRFRDTLARLMRRADLSQRQLADRAHISRSYLSEIVGGHATPSPEIVDALDTALDAGGDLSRLVLPAGTADHLAATAGGQPITPDTVAAFEAVLLAQRHLDDVVGSATMLPPVLAHLDTVSGLAARTTGPHRPALIRVAAQWAQFGGWLRTSTGSWPQARTLFGRALEWAIEGDDREMAATVVSYQGHVAWLTGQIPQSLGLAAAALRDPLVYPGQRAYDAYAAARAHAVLGDLPAAQHMLDLGEVLAGQAESWPGPLPPWQYYRAPWFWTLERGLVWLHMSRHQPGHAHAAVAELTAGITAMPADLAGADWAGEYLVQLAAAHRHAGQLEQARAVLDRARRIVADTRSERVRGLVAAQERRLTAIR